MSSRFQQSYKLHEINKKILQQIEWLMSVESITGGSDSINQDLDVERLLPQISPELRRSYEQLFVINKPENIMSSVPSSKQRLNNQIQDPSTNNHSRIAPIHRPVEMQSLIDSHPQFFNEIQIAFLSKEDQKGWADFLKLLLVPRSRMNDYTWMSKIENYLKDQPLLLSKLRKMIGNDDHHDTEIDIFDSVQQIPIDSGNEWVIYNTYDEPLGRQRTKSDVYVQLRDEHQNFASIESEFPLFFNLAKQHFNKAGDSSLYEKFMEVLRLPRHFLSDVEWVDYICETFFPSSNKLQTLFCNALGATDSQTSEIVSPRNSPQSMGLACIPELNDEPIREKAVSNMEEYQPSMNDLLELKMLYKKMSLDDFTCILREFVKMKIKDPKASSHESLQDCLLQMSTIKPVSQPPFLAC